MKNIQKMRTKSGKIEETTVPMFILKLWKLVNDPSTDDYIGWSEHNGHSTFTIRNLGKFSSELLPLYYKHNNLASFIRQLNMYGFRKISNIDQGALKMEKDDMEFYNPNFRRNEQGSLYLLERRTTPKSGVSGGGGGNEDTVKHQSLIDVLNDVSALYTKQETVNEQLNNIKRENEALWREVATLRQKHLKQQQVVAKLVEFLVNFFRSNRGLSVNKRKMPLMLDESPHQSKVPRLARTFSFDPKIPSDLASITAGFEQTDDGPVIHDVTDALDADDTFLVANDAALKPSTSSNAVAVLESVPDDIVLVKSPEESSPAPQTAEVTASAIEGVATTSSSMSADPMLASMNLALKDDVLAELIDVLNTENDFDSVDDTNPMLTNKLSPGKTPSVSELQDHVGTTQMELDNLKQMLANSGYTLDFSLLGVSVA
ncbi:stress-responsive transcription factor hsf1, variant 2 [Chamberlinius hualienensis]